MADYDIITVGGGIAGASLAKAMAEKGYRALVLESTSEFKDRVRGEFLVPWGVAEAKKIGVYEALVAAGGRSVPMMKVQAGPAPLPPRNLAEDTPFREPGMGIYHPAMQEAVLQAAEDAGAEIRRGARANKVTAGAEPSVEVDGDVITARLVAGADGRNSSVRKWAGFQVTEDKPQLVLSGVLLENVPIAEDASVMVFNFPLGQTALLFPQGNGRVRGYFGCLTSANVRLTGDGDFPKFVEESIRTGISAQSFEGAKQAGPLATFDGYDSWVPHPYKEGVVLIGDAAAMSDQTWGQGVAIGFWHTRRLRDALLSTDDWEAAGNDYANAAGAMFGNIHHAEALLTELLLDPGEQANALRAKVMPRMMTEPDLLPDTMVVGPEHAPVDDAVRARLLGA